VVGREDMYVICNQAHYSQFEAWATTTGFPRANIFNDGTTSNEDRLYEFHPYPFAYPFAYFTIYRGAVADLHLAATQFKLKERYSGVLVVAGDTLFLKDFSVHDFLSLARSNHPHCLVTTYTVSDADTFKTGIISVDWSTSTNSNSKTTADKIDTTTSHTQNKNAIIKPKLGKITHFLEKPGPTATPSRSACPCFYYLTSHSLDFLDTFLQEAKQQNRPLSEIDATGKFLGWLVLRTGVFAVEISGRLDIGGLESFVKAEEYLTNV
jgi:UTP-glucose-1-phosphate uridylyltransferase